ncbi:sugar nucleotide-binding protein [Marinomonas mediterranea]|jgi:dTDP-4-dehydrorhamnose reductase|uniref:dTDP-4-dehydrorhamnose reductase n=1 Tax=Marinomonas mediterranea (strain ATCC 700492 / JCM 21426 / NBRC 103028 / MMB-1) TaxID=717774 RepID=F2K477_MARM1|nr:sugar nucleotide-binding protein [Marinomonas mediterranea]ADZ92518.1 dTDP-4-dehydrorhamnose reductase [Marinomonas mediterranea MMB-1]WCN10464.1 sugar nucleotide-binding protein [Marinomonas mediterranea]WCN14512.1 sugar nucleotide-binding protein [Marinomonas mediterranea]WCN18563.1 sugar nucleotide-binding protein [Marinomonas mediterranea MMB-1]
MAVNKPIRVLLLGSDTELGEAIRDYKQVENEFQWFECATKDVVTSLEHDTLEYDIDFIIDTYSLRHAPENTYEEFKKLAQQKLLTLNVPVFMVSSVRVFSGDRNAAYMETDIPDAGSRYESALISMEQMLLGAERNIVLRTGWLFSGMHDDFVSSTIGLIQSGVNLAYQDNVIGSPTPVTDVARVTHSMIKQSYNGAENWGVYHYCCAEEVSWLGLVEAILATASQFDPRAQSEMDSINDSLAKEEGVTDIQRQSLSCRKIFNHYGIKQRSWRPTLRKLIKDLYKR